MINFIKFIFKDGLLGGKYVLRPPLVHIYLQYIIILIDLLKAGHTIKKIVKLLLC
jgi:hypothetical protein